MRAARSLVFAAICGVLASCAVGSGSGSVKGSLHVPGCGDFGDYDMNADFFGANAYRSQLIISIQHGGGIPEYADSLTITVQDMNDVESRIEASGGAGATFTIGDCGTTATAGDAGPDSVSDAPISDATPDAGGDATVADASPVGDAGPTSGACFERPPGSPVNLPPPPVQMVLNLRGLCGTQALNPTGDLTQIALEATGGTITFTSILHGDIQSRDTNSKRIEGTFSVHLADPRGWGTDQATGDITGNFKFFYQRGGPAQPFP
jgi:hypothetical protein